MDVYVMDIAVALARECRFNNATQRMYSVAEHSAWCALMAEEKYPEDKYLAFKCLMHDAHEYIWRDIPSPIKKLFPEYEHMQSLTQAAIETRYGIYTTRADLKRIKEIDKLALEEEWLTKVLNWKGMQMDEGSRVEYFLYHFKRLCRAPYVLTP